MPTPLHLAQFYEHEDQLFRSVADFLAPGFVEQEPMVVIATAPHRRGFVKELEARGFDVAQAHGAGLLTLLDARDCLSQFMIDGKPHREHFRISMGAALKSAARGEGRMRAYGEMVDLLWLDENPRAAAKLEELWSTLGTDHELTLLCSHGLSHTPRGDAPSVQQLCRAQKHLGPAPRRAPPSDVKLLEQRTAALEAEVRRRARLEADLLATLAERERSEAQLRASEQNLSDFLENAAEGIHAVGPDGVVLWANRAELELLGYEKHEYVGHHVSEFHADATALEGLLARLARGETVDDEPFQLVHKDGSSRDVAITSNALFRDGELVHSRCFTRSISEQRRLEAELKAQNEELTLAVRFAQQFVDVLGHDLRNPLSAITTAAGLLKRRASSEKLLRPAERILHSAERMSCMVDQLLDFTRVQLGRGLVLACRRIDLAELGRIMVEERATPRLKLEVLGDCLGCWDGDRLAQVLAVLLDNALSHGAFDTPVSVVIDGTDAAKVTLSVHNQGMISAERAGRLFEPGELRREGASGLGLGLFISRQIALAHRGTLELRSNEPDRTQFTLTLPRKV